MCFLLPISWLVETMAIQLQVVFHAVVLLLGYYVTNSESKNTKPTIYQFPKEWQEWKVTYGKNYTSQLEELDRHLVWLSNKEYIESHNAYSDVFGYTLELNKFADMVRTTEASSWEFWGLAIHSSVV